MSELVDALGTKPCREATITGLSVDNRTIQPGDCFVALKGTRVDATRFIPDALSRGAALAIGGPGSPDDGRVCVVDQPLEALGVLGRLVRDRYTGPTVGITGSAGKTTVKEMLRSLVGARRRAVFPERSHNNFEGVPRTLAMLTNDTELCVVELGTNSPGEIAALCSIARPTLGVLTSIGPAHLEGLGSVEGVLDEKLALARALPAGAPLIINADDPCLAAASYPPGLDVVRVGLDASPGVLSPPSDREARTLPVGDHVVSHDLGTRVLERNLWIAICVARCLGLDDRAIGNAVPDVRPAPLRGEVRLVGDATLILDCYNANPLSLGEAIDDLARCTGRRTAVIGEMLELGDATRAAHFDMGSRLAGVGVDRALFVGESGEAFAEGFRQGGGDAAVLDLYADTDQARGPFHELVRGGGTVLLKGSRGIALERLLEDGDD